MENATSILVSHTFGDGCLSRYPVPLRCLRDNRNEFLRPEFTCMLQRNKIKSIPTTVKNSQSSAIVERMYQSISTMIVISLRENLSKKYEYISSLIYKKCMVAQYAIRGTVHTTLQHTPGELAFKKGMINPFTKINRPY